MRLDALDGPAVDPSPSRLDLSLDIPVNGAVLVEVVDCGTCGDGPCPVDADEVGLDPVDPPCTPVDPTPVDPGIEAAGFLICLEATSSMSIPSVTLKTV